jgi:hypothetical protein
VRRGHGHGRGLVHAATEPLHGIGYTYGLLTRGNVVFAWHRDDLLVSHDAGCTYQVLATFSDWDFPPSLAAGRSLDRLYVWSDNRQYLIRFSDDGTVKLKPPVAFIGFAVDANNSMHVRGGGDDGSVWDSRDAGDTWTLIGRLEGGAIGYYRFAFDPSDLEHIVAGTVGAGAFVSRDGGSTWTHAAGFAERSNVFNLVVSPADGNRVWAMGLDLAGGARHIFQSEDGGASYAAVVDDVDGDVNLINGPVMAAHPTRRDVLYFVFGTRFQGYGTDLFRWDAGTRMLTRTHNDHHDINAIAFSTIDPNLIYLGFEVEEGTR